MMAVKRKSKVEKELDSICERAYYKHSQGFQIDIMKINALFDDFRKAIGAGGDVDETMKELVKKYCEPA